MVLTVFPLELWLNVLPRACQDDGTAGLSFSSASKELRFISKPYRYQSVQIKGWRQLLLFEERFSQIPEEERRIVNLFVDLENVFEAGYPGAPVWAPEDSDPDDASHVPSDDEDGTLASAAVAAAADTSHSHSKSGKRAELSLVLRERGLRVKSIGFMFICYNIS